MIMVRELLRAKGHVIWSVSPETTAFKALEIMAEKDLGALLVVQDEKLVGVFSERDYARKVILKGKSSKDTKVSDLMTRKVFYISPEETIDQCMAMMTAKHIRHLPVLEEGKLVGIVTIGDVVKKVIDLQEFTIHELEKYITGGL